MESTLEMLREGRLAMSRSRIVSTGAALSAHAALVTAAGDSEEARAAAWTSGEGAREEPAGEKEAQEEGEAERCRARAARPFRTRAAAIWSHLTSTPAHSEETGVTSLWPAPGVWVRGEGLTAVNAAGSTEGVRVRLGGLAA